MRALLMTFMILGLTSSVSFAADSVAGNTDRNCKVTVKNGPGGTAGNKIYVRTCQPISSIGTLPAPVVKQPKEPVIPEDVYYADPKPTVKDPQVPTYPPSYQPTPSPGYQTPGTGPSTSPTSAPYPVGVVKSPSYTPGTRQSLQQER